MKQKPKKYPSWFSPSCRPIPPQAPVAATRRFTKIREINISDGDEIDLTALAKEGNAVIFDVRCGYGGDHNTYGFIIGTYTEIKNPLYDKELKQYNKQFAIHQKRAVEWHNLSKQYQDDKKENTERVLFEKLRVKYEKKDPVRNQVKMVL